jgi:predicted AlkP superfamily pyrophosphatase or phosphodiesterase
MASFWPISRPPQCAETDTVELNRYLFSSLIRRSFIAIVAIGLSTWTVVANDEVAHKKVLLIGIDGCRPDALRIAATPHLDQLIHEGAFADDTQILGRRYTDNDTISGPGWSSILTGVWADKHGVNGNEFHDPNYDEYPHFFRRIKEVQPSAYTVSLTTWAPITDKIVTAADVSRQLREPQESYAKGDQAVAEEAVRLLQEENPTAMFVYFGNVDETGHVHGFHPSVQPYVAEIEAVDQLVGQVLKALRARQTYGEEDWLILVGTDHGGQGLGHGDGQNVPEIRNVFIIASGPAAARGKIVEPTFIVDMVPTALVHLGVRIDPVWKLDGRCVGLKQE